jgi:O-succinylbenzoic acid--CoA ligase
VDRAELSDSLRAWRSKEQGAESGEPILISQANPQDFMTAFSDAVGGKSVIFLCDPKWGATEQAQLETLVRSPNSSLPAPGLPQGWLCIPTGGTSGRLKFARHDQETLVAAVRGFSRHFGLARVNAAGVLPLYHVSGLMAWLRCALTGGEYLPLDWKAVEAGDLPVLPAKPDGWTISLVPTQLERLVANEGAVAWLKGFRIIFLGGGPAWPALLDRAAAAGLRLSLGYGMTETAAMVTALRPEEFLAGARNNGTALPYATVRVGESDTIVIGGDSLFRGYYPQWREEGDFETQDRGLLDERNHLFVLGRRDAVIISGGEKVEPAEVEGVLRGTGQFSDVVVLGLPDEKWGQVVVAVYPATNSPDLGAVRTVLSTRLAAHKRPKRYIPIGTWPVNAQGKVDRAEIIRQVMDAF